MKIGYALVNTADQSLNKQRDELTATGCERIFAESASGKRGAARPEWDRMLANLRAGDHLVVVELSRLGRRSGDLLALLDLLDEQQVGLSILDLGVDTSTPAGRLICTVDGAVATTERDLLIERIRSGLEVAKAYSRVGRRRSTITEAQIRRARELHRSGNLTSAEVTSAVGITRASLGRLLSEVPTA